MYCKKCGNKLRDGAHFCEKCGSPITASASRPRQRSWSASNVIAPYGRPAAITAVSARRGSAAEWRQASTPELGGPARRIMTNRGLLKYILLSILTLGIYGFYFVYMMAQDMNTMCEDDDQKTGGLIAFIVLSILTLGIYNIYWWYKIANRVYLNAPRYSIAISGKGSSFLLYYFLGLLSFGIISLVGYHIVIRNVNSLAAAYNRTHGFV